MEAANQVVRSVLNELKMMTQPGITTKELDVRARELAADYGVKPAFLGYGNPPFPATICVSVNDEVIHGIPSEDRILEEGDIVSVDFGVEREGFCGDAAETWGVGEISADAKALLSVTRGALDSAIKTCICGKRLRDVSRAIEKYVRSNGFSVVHDFGGHGIGRQMHEDPYVPNYVDRWRHKNPKLKEGMVLAIEPMVNIGSSAIKIDQDGWTVRTEDGKLSAHFEHSVAITSDGPRVLSRSKGDHLDLRGN